MKEKKIKLSAKQKIIVKQIREGWTLKHLTGLNPHAYMSHPTNGMTGGVSMATVGALEDKGITEGNRSDWRCVVYSLTDLGKTIEL